MPHQEHKKHCYGLTQADSWETWEGMNLIIKYWQEWNKLDPYSVCHVFRK
jgi:hypothetical protein